MIGVLVLAFYMCVVLPGTVLFMPRAMRSLLLGALHALLGLLLFFPIGLDPQSVLYFVYVPIALIGLADRFGWVRFTDERVWRALASTVFALGVGVSLVLLTNTIHPATTAFMGLILASPLLTVRFLEGPQEAPSGSGAPSSQPGGAHDSR